MSVEIKMTGNANKGINDGFELSAMETAIKVTSQAKALSPVDGGLLRGSIMWRTSRSEGGLEKGQSLAIKPKQFEAFVGTATEYSAYVEFGTKRQRAQPYLRPAVSIISGQSPTEIIKILNQEMGKNTKKS